jgi:osmotically-inducible protein OsmY
MAKRTIMIACAIACAPLLSGCWLMAGAAAGGAAGYYVAKDERPAGQIAEDASITAKVKTKFAADERIPAMKINVDTYYNVVTLHGDVPSGAIAERAIKIARATEGVRGVRSELVVVP